MFIFCLIFYTTESKVDSYTGGQNASRPQTNRKRTTMRNQSRNAALGRPAMKLLGGFNYFAVNQPSPLDMHWFLRHLIVLFAWSTVHIPKKIIMARNIYFPRTMNVPKTGILPYAPTHTLHICPISCLKEKEKEKNNRGKKTKENKNKL